jgi:hypothetical protein
MRSRGVVRTGIANGFADAFRTSSWLVNVETLVIIDRFAGDRQPFWLRVGPGIAEIVNATFGGTSRNTRESGRHDRPLGP